MASHARTFRSAKESDIAVKGAIAFIGVLDGDGDFRLREACNKIIHATDFRPVYEHADREIVGGEPQRVWHLDGQIELAGVQGKRNWEVVLFVEQFLEVVLDVLESKAWNC